MPRTKFDAMEFVCRCVASTWSCDLSRLGSTLEIESSLVLLSNDGDYQIYYDHLLHTELFKPSISNPLSPLLHPSHRLSPEAWQ